MEHVALDMFGVDNFVDRLQQAEEAEEKELGSMFVVRRTRWSNKQWKNRNARMKVRVVAGVMPARHGALCVASRRVHEERSLRLCAGAGRAATAHARVRAGCERRGAAAAEARQSHAWPRRHRRYPRPGRGGAAGRRETDGADGVYDIAGRIRRRLRWPASLACAVGCMDCEPRCRPRSPARPRPPTPRS